MRIIQARKHSFADTCKQRVLLSCRARVSWLRRPCFRGVLLALCVALSPTLAHAVIIIGSSAGNTSAPADAGLATRWSQVGNFGSFLGTPIASQFFVTAKHIGLPVGTTITFADSTSYTTTARFTDPSSDLAIYQISGVFSGDKIVPMYSGAFSANQAMAIFGRGVPRTNTDVIGNRVGSGTEAKGWTWGTGGGTRSWGTNTLDGIAAGGASLGDLLAYDFDLAGGNDQGTLSTGDSGGPVFMQVGGEWQLAGINYAVEAAFSTTGTGTGLNAAIYDKGGLYESTSSTTAGPWQYVSPTAANQATYAYSTSLPANSAWISSVITVPEPGTWALLVSAGAVVGGLRWCRRGSGGLRRSKHVETACGGVGS